MNLASSEKISQDIASQYSAERNNYLSKDPEKKKQQKMREKMSQKHANVIKIPFQTVEYIYIYEFMMHPLQEMQFGIVRVQRSAFAESDPQNAQIGIRK